MRSGTAPVSRRQVVRWLGSASGLALTAPLGLWSLSACTEAPVAPTTVRTLEAAAALALAKAQEAERAGTFGVGGVLVDLRSGRVLRTMRNRVLERLGSGLGDLSGRAYPRDPTAHGERQLVTWYQENRTALGLPAPEDLLVVTTLDPCAMCSGALVAAGFLVAVVAPDDFAGIDWDGRRDFAAYPDSVSRGLVDRFGYMAVDGRRAFRGPSAFPWRDQQISATTAAGCESVFISSAEAVRAASVGAGLPPERLTDPATLPADHAMRAAWRQACPEAFTVRLAAPRRPDAALESVLVELVARSPGARNAVAFIDPFGNLLWASADRFDRAATSTAFMAVTQSYAATRYEMSNDPRTTAAASACLTSPRFGTFVFLYAPDPGQPTTLMELGAFGSTMEGAIPIASPSALQYFRAPRQGTAAELEALVQAMPPFYRALVGIRPERVAA